MADSKGKLSEFCAVNREHARNEPYTWNSIVQDLYLMYSVREDTTKDTKRLWKKYEKQEDDQ